MPKTKRAVIRSAAITGALVIALVAVATVYAAASFTMTISADCSDLPPGSVSFTAGAAGTYAVSYDYSVSDGTHASSPSGLTNTYTAGQTRSIGIGLVSLDPGETFSLTYSATGPESASITATGQCSAAGVLTYTLRTGGPTAAGATEPPSASPSVWLADVCEPDDGFSAEGWMTLGSDVSQKGQSNQLYVAASNTGTWNAVDIPGPSYILSRDSVEALTNDVGLTDYHDLWFKVSPIGTPAKLGSMIIDRQAHMTSLCGS